LAYKRLDNIGGIKMLFIIIFLAIIFVVFHWLVHNAIRSIESLVKEAKQLEKERLALEKIVMQIKEK